MIRRGTRLTLTTVVASLVLGIVATSASAVAPTILSTGVSGVTATSATLEASIHPQAKLTRYRFEYGPADCADNPCTSIPVPEGTIPAGGSPVTVKVTLEGLPARTLFHFRVVTRNGGTPADETKGPDRVFATRGTPIDGLPDNRAYEQASPIDKNGGDVIGTVPQIKATPSGDGITFSSTVGIPGGVGAQEFPLYLARRSASGWSTLGLMPPASAGQKALIVGWLPGFSRVFSSATQLGEPDKGALLSTSSPSVPPEKLTDYLPNAEYDFLGSGGDGGAVVVFESEASLGTPPGVAGASNVYAWDRESGGVSLVSVKNDGAPLAKGAFGGSYDWAAGSSPNNLSQGGAARNYYTQDQHAVTSDGAVFFTEADTGQLFMRVNPTQPQSALAAGKCTEPDKACTIHVSASQSTPPDPAGPRPAAFMGAAADGSAAFFTSPEKLTDDANTGPTQPAPKIGRVDIDGETDLEPDFLANHRAVGLALDSEYIYWANPIEGTIGRAELDGDNSDDDFIVLEPITVKEEVETEPDSGEFETIEEEVPSKPRYVAVDDGHIYWTNAVDGKVGHGLIGRAALNPTTKDPEDIEPECITGASNPQGIAVNEDNIYWANSGSEHAWSIGRAAIECDGAQQNFVPLSNSERPFGVALNGARLYWTLVKPGSGFSFLMRVPLAGAADKEFHFISDTADLRGIAVAGDDVYWAAQGEKAIGHAVWPEPVTPDPTNKPTTVESKFIELDGAPSGVAVNVQHILFSTDGETLPSPGNDLYRFVPDGEGGGDLTDLAPVPSTENGAEVQGVVGVSEDGSRVYFTANADLDGAGPAQAGSCKGPPRLAEGQCSLYLWREGTVSFVARLNATGSTFGSDVSDWAPTTTLFGGSDFQKTAFLSADGQTLLFRSQEQLTPYDNKGIPQLYRFREGEPIVCASCSSSGEAPKGAPTLGTIKPSSLRAAEPASLASRNLSADGNRVFFETVEALVTSDTNGLAGCPPVGATLQAFPACRDVYEWEAPGSGSCKESSPAFSPLNGGCLYLLSSGKDDYPSLFADASESGDDVFFFTREGLVGQDKDELLDVYDARVGGGLASQNPQPVIPCESTEACHGPVPAPPPEGQPSTQTFVGPGNEVPKKGKKAKKAKKHKKHRGKRKSKKKNAKQRRANPERRATR